MRKFYSVKAAGMFLLLALCQLMVQTATGQIAAYSFASTSGTYTPITGGTAITYGMQVTDASVSVATLDDERYYNRPIGFSFTYNGVSYTEFGFNSNGWLILGNSTSFGSSTSPISSSTAALANLISAGTYDLGGVVKVKGTLASGANSITITSGATTNVNIGDSVTGTNIPSPGAVVTAITASSITIDKTVSGASTSATWYVRNGEIRYQTIGTAPNRILVLQFKGFGRWSSTYQQDVMNFQIRLHETSNKVEIVYGTWSSLYTGTSTTPNLQVGLKGADNSDFNNRTTTTSWNASTAGTANSAEMRFNSTVFPASGLTYTWTPPTCIYPSGVTISAVTASTATISWTASPSAPANGYEYELRTAGAAGSGATGLAASGTTAAGVVTANIPGLTAGTVYSVYVRANCGSGDFSAWTAAETFTTTQVNDECSGAISLTPTAYNATCTGYAATTAGATQSTGAPSCTSTGNNDDVWFKFTATSTEHIVKFSGMTAVTGTATALGMELYSGSCGSLTAISGSCDATFGSAGAGEMIVGGLAVGTEYLLRVWAASTSNTATFNLCVMQPTAPTACVTSPSPANAATNIALNPYLSWTASALATNYDVYLGTANPPTTLLGNTTTTSIEAPGLTANTTYYWYVVSKNSVGQNSGCTVYSFTTSANAPANDDCVGAITVTHENYNAGCTGTSFNTLNATKSGTPSSFFSSSQDDDLWYKFVATADKMVIRFTSIAAASGTAGNMAYALYAGSSCGTFTDLGGNSVTITSGAGETAMWYGLTVGNTYYVRIASSGTTFRATGNVCILVPDVAAGTANTCASAGALNISAANSNNNRWMPLIIGSSIIGEINAQGNDLGAITGKVYVNSGALRQETTSNRYYLDRNFEITPATQPTTPVKVRLYILGSELNAMMANPASGVTSLNSLNITKTDATCSGVYTGTGTFIIPDARVTYSGSNAYVEFTTSSFSSFFIHGGVGVLPVNIGEFTGEVKASANRLRWNTLTETNNSGFELQRSNDGNVFSAIGFIPTKADDGFSTTPLDYGFDDLKPLAGASYYRLKQVDRDGKYSYSKVVQLNRKVESLTIAAIYPNPAVEELNLVIIAPAAEKANLVVTDLTGKVVAQQSLQLQQGSSRTSLRVASLSAGTYLVKLVCNNGCETAVKRFVKN